jgi:hypothetical protein
MSNIFLPGLTVTIVLELTVAAIQFRKLSKLILASAMKRTLRKESRKEKKNTTVGYSECLYEDSQPMEFDRHVISALG